MAKEKLYRKTCFPYTAVVRSLSLSLSLSLALSRSRSRETCLIPGSYYKQKDDGLNQGMFSIYCCSNGFLSLSLSPSLSLSLDLETCLIPGTCSYYKQKDDGLNQGYTLVKL